MAECITVHLRDLGHSSVAALLAGMSPMAAGTNWWQFGSAERGYLVLATLETGTLCEYGPEERRQFATSLGVDAPAASLYLEFRRSAGAQAVEEALRITVELLILADGVVDDDIGELWTREEILNAQRRPDGIFLDCYRQ